MLLRILKSFIVPKSQEPAESIESRIVRLLRDKKPDKAKELILSSLNAENPSPMQIALLGEAEYHLKNIDESERLFLDALHAKPGLAIAHYGLSLIYYDKGLHNEALSQAIFARNRSPSEGRILAQLGLCAISTHNYTQAHDALFQAALADPENVPVLNNLGIALHGMHQTKEALYYFQRALTLAPDYAQAKENLRLIFGINTFHTQFDSDNNTITSQLDDDLAEHIPDQETTLTEALESSFATSPDDEETATSLITHHLKTLNLEAARDILNIALAHSPDSAPLLTFSGRIAHTLGQFMLAKSQYEAALSINPDYVPALMRLGRLLRQCDLHEDALAPIEHACCVSDSPVHLLQLHYSQVNACQYDKALTTSERIEALKPEFAPLMASSRAVCNLYLGHFDQALNYMDEAEKYEPLNPSFTMFRGMLNLMQERYAVGWDGYRNRALGDAKNLRLLPYAEWNYEPIEGKIILILAEQGLGDQVMFASCLSDLLCLNPKQVVLEAHQRVEKTLARSFPQITVFPSGQRDFSWLPVDLKPDYYAALGDLPRHFRRGIQSFPNISGYLQADADRVRYWQERLSELNSLPKVGVSWRGGMQQTRRAIRSLQLEQLDTLFNKPHIQYISLQYGEVGEELSNYCNAHDREIIYWPEAIQDLDEFAALITALDLVITVCNTTVHYTGALGKSCWVMTPFIPEWRYGLKSEQMRWYPSVRMFRQSDPGNWAEPIDNIAMALDVLFDAASLHPKMA